MFSKTRSSFYYKNIYGNKNLAYGHIFVKLSKTIYAINLNKASYEWMQSQSIYLCERFLNISTFHGFFQLRIKGRKIPSVTIADSEKCCTL